MELEPIFITAIVFGFTYAVIYLFIRRSERLALLAKGVDASIFLNPRPEQGVTALKFGLLFMGVALGIFLGGILHDVMGIMQEEAAYFSMIFLFGGTALVISHFIEKSERKTLDK